MQYHRGMFPKGVIQVPSSRIEIPRLLDASECYRLSDSAIDGGKPKSSKIEFDFTKLEFCKPSGMVFLANLLEWLRVRSVDIKLTLPPSRDGRHRFAQTEPLKYLDDSGFFRRWTGNSIFPWSSLRPTTIALKVIRAGETHSWIENEFMPWITARSKLDPTAFEEIIVSLKEIFNNISDHSGVSYGFAFAQVYPEKKSLVVAISDFGVGIPTNVRRVHPGISDAQAIQEASQEGFTTGRTGRNLGLGLDTLIRYTLKTNGGTVLIRSASGLLVCARRPTGEVRTPHQAPGHFPGTLVEFAFHLDRLESNVDLPRDLPWSW